MGIHITAGLKPQTARWSLKMIMEQYGKVDTCHMGDRANPAASPTWVQYQSKEAAEKAMAALEAGTVISQGEILRGEWRTETSRPPTVGYKDIGPEVYTSRDLAPSRRDRGDRDRDRRRGGSRSRSRDNRRAQDTPYNSRYPTCPLGHDIEKIKEREQACACCHTGLKDDNPIMRCNECRYLICERCAKNRVLS